MIANYLTVGEHVSSLAVIAFGPDGRFGAMIDHAACAGAPGRMAPSSLSPSHIIAPSFPRVR